MQKVNTGETRRQLGVTDPENIFMTYKEIKDISKLVARHCNHPFQTAYGSLQPFPASKQFRKTQKSTTKIYLSNRHS